MLPLKRCRSCNQDLPLSSFGVDRSRLEGLNLYCRPCAYQKVLNRRARFNRKEQIKKLEPRISRKAMRLSKRSPRSAVLYAIHSGATTREDIRRRTRLQWDVLCDLLAELWDEQEIKIVEGRFKLAA